MTTQEKVDVIEKFFYDNYIDIPIGNGLKYLEDTGTCIPAQTIRIKDNKVDYVNIGDGTCNLAYLMTLIWTKGKCNNGSNFQAPITIAHCLNTYYRLEETAFKLFEVNWYVAQYGLEPGFFVRDDINGGNIKSSFKMLITPIDEDPCHSSFVSQDQVWNLNLILAQLAKEGNDRARLIGLDINNYIAKNGYTVYNPYLSKLMYFHTYCPTFNEDKVAPWDRQQDRAINYKPTVKVKRGANNWYYSGGTKAAVKFFSTISPTGGLKFNSLREVIYKGIVFVLDRIYEPVFRAFTGSDFKHNSYYCYAVTSGIWYNSKFKRRFINKFNKSIKTAGTGEPFEWNIAPFIVGSSNTINVSDLYNYLIPLIDKWYNIANDFNNGKIANGVYSSPISMLVLWYMYCGLIEGKL